MLEALGLGLLGASSLLLAGLFACWVKVPARLVGIMAGFGAGALIAAISFDLIPEAEDQLEHWQFALWMMIGVAVFLLADQFVEKRFGEAGVGGAMGIVVGSVVDGVPESLIFGNRVGTAFPISLAFSPRSSSPISRRASRHRPTSRPPAGARNASGSRGSGLFSPAASQRALAIWPLMRALRCREDGQLRSLRAVCSRC